MNTYEYYNKILEDHKNDYAFLTRLEIVDNLNGLNVNLTEAQKDNLIMNLTEYWLSEDLQESSLFDITFMAVTHNLYNHTVEQFYEEMDKLV